MTRSEFLDELAEILEVPADQIKEADVLEDLGWSSLSMISFAALVDSSFSQSLSSDALSSAQTVGDLIRLVEPRLGA